MMGVLHSYTMEASFGGASEGPRAGTHYNIQDLISMGRQFCETLVEYFDPQPIKVIALYYCWVFSSMGHVPPVGGGRGG